METAMRNIYFQQTFQRAFGTFPLRGRELRGALEAALRIGYRAIDTAQMYDNEAEVGEVLASSGISRAELCITTKIHPENFGADKFFNSVSASLKALRVEQVDALLLHWPAIDGDISPSLRLLERAHREGLTRHIGVSNYTADMMRMAKRTIETPLIVNQVEFHPLLDQSILLHAAAETGIALSSYCSVARGEVFKYPIFTEIGAGYGKTAAQVVLRWILQRGLPINTMSTKTDNITANFEVMDFVLSSIDMGRIDAMNKVGLRVVDKSLVPWAPAWD
jgi:2,5-diketo-D-gluconate reductase B